MHNKTSIIITLLLIAFSSHMKADDYDELNYPPMVDTITIDQTNLPILFIDTSCGDTTTHAIHKDYRIGARMKIINNANGINYGDTVTHPSQTADYEGWVAIRYRGESSFYWSDKKPFNFKTMYTSDPNGEKRKTTILNMPKDNTWVLIGVGDRSLLRDVLMFQLERPYFEYTPRCCYCEVVLDGIYYGVYVLAENIRKGEYRLNLCDPGSSGDALTGGYQLQIDRDNEPFFTSKYLAVDSLGRTYDEYNEIYIQYKHPDYNELLPEQMEYIQQRLNSMEDVLASDNFTNPETGYSKYLDTMSFIDQQLAQEVSGNVDGYRLSTNIYKRRDNVDPRFKTAIWDFNLAFGNTDVVNAIGTDFWRYQNSYLTGSNAFNKVPFWWMRLMEDPAYVTKLKERWAQYRQENFQTNHIEATIDSITSLLKQEGALQRTITAWKFFNSSTYDMEIDKVKNWILKRIAWMDEQLDYTPNSSITVVKKEMNKTIIGYYNLNGMPLENPSNGSIVIVRFADGTTRKVVIQH